MRGRPEKANPKKEVLQIRLTTEEKSLIKYMAENNGNISMTEFIMELIIEEYTRWKIEDVSLNYTEI